MYSSYKRQRILHFTLMGHEAPTISRLLREEDLRTSRVGMHKFLQKYKETRSIERRPGCGRSMKMTPAVKALVELQMREDDETTAIQLHALLLRNGHTMTLKTVLRCRADLFNSFYSPLNRLRSFILQLNRFLTIRPFHLNDTVSVLRKKIVPFRTVFLKTEC